MARANSNTNRNACEATAIISGTIKEVFEGKKYDYVTIRVDHDYDEYYDLFKVACGKDFLLPSDGEYISLKCAMRNYKGDITFKEVTADTQ